MTQQALENISEEQLIVAALSIPEIISGTYSRFFSISVSVMFTMRSIRTRKSQAET